jgi:hypothetical protein
MRTFFICRKSAMGCPVQMYRVRLPRHKETLAEKQKREDKYFTVKEMKLLLDAMEKKANQIHY